MLCCVSVARPYTHTQCADRHASLSTPGSHSIWFVYSLSFWFVCCHLQCDIVFQHAEHWKLTLPQVSSTPNIASFFFFFRIANNVRRFFLGGRSIEVAVGVGLSRDAQSAWLQLESSTEKTNPIFCNSLTIDPAQKHKIDRCVVLVAGHDGVVAHGAWRTRPSPHAAGTNNCPFACVAFFREAARSITFALCSTNAHAPP